jgi:uncharacterized protein YdeI (YjbR/CyaY-like superfamily)
LAGALCSQSLVNADPDLLGAAGRFAARRFTLALPSRPAASRSSMSAANPAAPPAWAAISCGVEMNPKLDVYFAEATKWYAELNRLRTIVVDCGLSEDMKWRQPCYTFGAGIVLLISPFKDYCALAFFKGALLKDPRGVLVAPGENSQAMRHIRFTGVREIVEQEPVIRSYIREAIEIEKAGLKIEKHSEHAVPEEFQTKLDENPGLKMAFEALTPGRRRAYLMHFAQPKQSKTREARIEKSLPQILEGKGLDHDHRSTQK